MKARLLKCTQIKYPMKKSMTVATMIAMMVGFACTHQALSPGGNDNNTDSTGNSGGPGNGGSGGNSDTLVCFEGDILPIFISSCAKSGCHDAASGKEGYVLNSYQNITKKGIVPGKASDSKIFRVLTEDGDDRMPQSPYPPLLASQIDLVKRWINEGAKNTVNCIDQCDTALFTYSGAVRPILDAYCANCHSGSILNGGVDLGNYNGVNTAALNGRLLGAITHSAGYIAMPQGGSRLSDCNIAQIRKWINAGSPDN